MNGKKAKQIRAAAKSLKSNLPNVSYEQTNVHHKQYGFHEMGIGGVKQPAFAKVNTTVLANCKKLAAKKLKNIFTKGVPYNFNAARSIAI